MSSHHFVREGQEPALFILDQTSFSIIEPLLEWAPLVMVAENAVELVLSWGIKIDTVIRRDRSLHELEQLLENQFPVEVIAIENQMVAAVLGIIEAKGHVGINIVGQRSDEVLEIIENFDGNLQVNLLASHQKWSFIKHGSYEKWLQPGTTITIRTKSSGNLSTKGLENVMGQRWSAVSPGPAVINSNQPLWIAEDLWSR